MKLLSSDLKSPIPFVADFFQIKKYFSGKLLREIPGILADPGKEKSYRTKMYLTTGGVYLFVKKIDSFRNALYGLDQTDVFSLKTIDDTALKEAVNYSSTTTSGTVTSEGKVVALSINSYDMLCGISDIGMFQRAGGSFASGYAKIIYKLGKRYAEEVRNLLSIVQIIVKGTAPDPFPRILPGSHPQIALVQAYTVTVFYPLFVIALVSVVLFRQPVIFIYTIVPFVIIIAGLLAADKLMKYR